MSKHSDLSRWNHWCSFDDNHRRISCVRLPGGPPITTLRQPVGEGGDGKKKKFFFRRRDRGTAARGGVCRQEGASALRSAERRLLLGRAGKCRVHARR